MSEANLSWNETVEKLTRLCESMKLKNEELTDQVKVLQQEKSVLTDKYIKVLETLSEKSKNDKPAEQQTTNNAANVQLHIMPANLQGWTSTVIITPNCVYRVPLQSPSQTNSLTI